MLELGPAQSRCRLRPKRIEVLASDISVEALAIAERNRAAHDAKVSFFAADLLTCAQPRSVDLLVSNPPYVPGADESNMQAEVRDWEPHVALFAGATGFEIYRRLISQAHDVVRPGGRLLLEMGYQSLEGVRQMLTQLGLTFR
jgi:release factor glutamine methyltransferase